MSYFAKRFSEPSTWAGLALLISHGAQAWANRDPVAIAGTIGGLAAILAPEKSPG